MSIAKDSKTAKNLAAAFAGESQARTRYACFASVARGEGYSQIADVFGATANNENGHADIWLEALDAIGGTAENLAAAAAAEHGEWTGMYRRFAEDAADEGYDDIACLFAQVADIEQNHEERFRKLLAGIENREVQADSQAGDSATRWECLNCGHIFEGEKAPEICPTCKREQSFFKVEA